MERLNWQSVCESVLQRKAALSVNKVYLPCTYREAPTPESFPDWPAHCLRHPFDTVSYLSRSQF